MVFIYILELEHDKYYVVKTSKSKFRFHFIDNCEWTKNHHPIKILESIPNCEDIDEDKYTLKYMKLYGIDNVRGGRFSSLILSNEVINIINTLNTYECIYCNKEFVTLKDFKNHDQYCDVNPYNCVYIKNAIINACTIF